MEPGPPGDLRLPTPSPTLPPHCRILTTALCQSETLHKYCNNDFDDDIGDEI